MILIIDGNNLAYRALHTVSLSTTDGTDVSILYGMLNMLKSLIMAYQPTSLVVAFDGGTPEFRKHVYPAYKTHRKKSDDMNWDSIFAQMDEMRRNVLPLHGIKILWARHVEADDLMAHYAQLCIDRPYIVTTDNDLLQCVDDKVSVINPSKGKIYSNDNFEDELGVPIGYWLLYKALVGDASDNIAGISSIGPKTAIKIVNNVVAYGDVNWYDLGVLLTIAKETDGVNTRQISAIQDMGDDDWQDMLDVMDLSIDLVGARIGIILSKPWMAAKEVWIKKWLFRREFISLMSAEYYGLWNRLVEPKINLDGIRTPVPYIQRRLV